MVETRVIYRVICFNHERIVIESGMWDISGMAGQRGDHLHKRLAYFVVMSCVWVWRWMMTNFQSNCITVMRSSNGPTTWLHHWLGIRIRRLNKCLKFVSFGDSVLSFQLNGREKIKQSHTWKYEWMNK